MNIGCAGYDLYSVEDVVSQPHEKTWIATDIALIYLQGLYLPVAPRSLMTMKNTDVAASVIDSDYTGTSEMLLTYTI